MVQTPLPAQTGNTFGSAEMAEFPPVDRLSYSENGDFGVGAVWFSTLAATIGVFGGISIAVAVSAPIGVVLGAGSAVVVVVGTRLGLQRWSGRRRYRRHRFTGATQPSSAALR